MARGRVKDNGQQQPGHEVAPVADMGGEFFFFPKVEFCRSHYAVFSKDGGINIASNPTSLTDPPISAHQTNEFMPLIPIFRLGPLVSMNSFQLYNNDDNCIFRNL